MAEEIENWIPVAERMPTEVGQYKCKNEEEEFPCFLVSTLSKNKIWLKPSFELQITHWLEGSNKKRT